MILLLILGIVLHSYFYYFYEIVQIRERMLNRSDRHWIIHSSQIDFLCWWLRSLFYYFPDCIEGMIALQ